MFALAELTWVPNSFDVSMHTWRRACGIRLLISGVAFCVGMCRVRPFNVMRLTRSMFALCFFRFCAIETNRLNVFKLLLILSTFINFDQL